MQTESAAEKGGGGVIEWGCFDGAGGSNRPDSLPMRFGAMLDPAKHRIVPLPYPASIGPANTTPNPIDVGSGMASSIAAAVEVAAAFAAESPHKVGFIGYSLGASCVCAIREAIAGGEIVNQDGSPILLAGSVTIANPLFADPHLFGGTRQEGWFGLAGKHGDLGPEPHWEIANPPDAVPLTPPGSPLRSIVPLGNVLTFTLDEAVVRSWQSLWAEEIRIQTERLAAVGLSNPQWWLQPWNIDRARREIQAIIDLYVHAIKALRGYLDGTSHVTDYLAHPGGRMNLLERTAVHVNARFA